MMRARRSSANQAGKAAPVDFIAASTSGVEAKATLPMMDAVVGLVTSELSSIRSFDSSPAYPMENMRDRRLRIFNCTLLVFS